jgi:ribosomal protein S27AE
MRIWALIEETLDARSEENRVKKCGFDVAVGVLSLDRIDEDDRYNHCASAWYSTHEHRVLIQNKQKRIQCSTSSFMAVHGHKK